MSDLVLFPSTLSPSAGLALFLERTSFRKISMEEYLAVKIPAPLFDEAERLADRMRAMAEAAPASARAVEAWLRPIAAAVRNPPTEDDFPLRAGAIVEVCCDLPGWLFSRETRLAAMRKFPFLPAAADVYDLLTAFHQPFCDTRARMDRLISRGPAPADMAVVQ